MGGATGTVFSSTVYVVAAIAAFIVVIAIARDRQRQRRSASIEPFAGVMTSTGGLEADWTSATFDTPERTPFSFKAESVVQNLTSTDRVPSTLLVKDGQGLLSEPAGACALVPDVVAPEPDNPGQPRWVNPLTEALNSGKLVSSIAPTVVSSIPRCEMALVPAGVSMAALALLDKQIMEAGADFRSQKFRILAAYESQVAQLKADKAAAQAAEAAAQADSDKASGERDDVEYVQLPQMQTDLTAATNVNVKCTGSALPAAAEATGAAQDKVAACKTTLTTMQADASEDATYATITQSLALHPFKALSPECIVAKAQYHDKYRDVLQAGTDAWVHYATKGKTEGRTWTGGDACIGTDSGVADGAPGFAISNGEFLNVRFYTTGSGQVALSFGDSAEVLAYFTAGKKLLIHNLVAAGATPATTTYDGTVLTVTGSENDPTGAYTNLDFTPSVTFPPDQTATFSETVLEKVKPPPQFDVCKFVPLALRAPPPVAVIAYQAPDFKGSSLSVKLNKDGSARDVHGQEIADAGMGRADGWSGGPRSFQVPPGLRLTIYDGDINGKSASFNHNLGNLFFPKSDGWHWDDCVTSFRVEADTPNSTADGNLT